MLADGFLLSEENTESVQCPVRLVHRNNSEGFWFLARCGAAGLARTKPRSRNAAGDQKTRNYKEGINRSGHWFPFFRFAVHGEKIPGKRAKSC